MSEPAAPAPDQFYTGLVAEMYRHLRSGEFDPAPFAKLIRRYGEPALELGCGDGDPLLALVADGLHVEGLDSSADMLRRCRSRAAAQGLHVALHHSPMESMEIGRGFNTIYLAGPTFNLLPNDDDALHALRRIRSHLLPGGVALVPLMVPVPTPAKQFGRVRSHLTDDGAEMRFSALGEQRDEAARTQTTTLRYEMVANNTVTASVERDWLLHWYLPSTFSSLVTLAGLDVVWVRGPDRSPVTDASLAFSFLLTPGAAGNTHRVNE